MFRIIRNKIAQVPSDLSYYLDRFKHVQNLPDLSSSDRQIVEALNEEGVAITSLDALGLEATPKLHEATHQWLSNVVKAVQLPNTAANASTLSIKPNQFTTLTDYPDFFLWGLQDRLLDILESYIGLPVAYHGVNLRFDVAKEKLGDTNYWHRDGEDRRTLKVIVYLSDVGIENGPFEYIPKSRTPSLLSLNHLYPKILKSGFSSINNQEMRQAVPESEWKVCLGSAGTVVFADVRNVFHRGRCPNAERSALFYAYTSQRPKRPDICKANFKFDQEQLLALAQTLPLRQKSCILWEQN